MSARAFTLLEVIVSSMLLSIVMSAATALLFITARSLPAGEDPALTATETLRAMDMLASELAFATGVTVAEPQRIEFTIRDRDADSLDDTIAYGWTGVQGDPLTRTEGARDPQAVVGSMTSLALSYSLTGDSARIEAVHIRAHPHATRASMMPMTVRLLNRPAAP